MAATRFRSAILRAPCRRMHRGERGPLRYSVWAFRDAMRWARERKHRAITKALESIPLSGLHRNMDCDSRRQHRHVDVQRRFRLADDNLEFGPAHRLIGSSRYNVAAVS